MTMLERILPVAVVALAAIAVISAFLLVRAALERPYIGALVERAVIAVVIAAFGVVSAFLILNSETGRMLVPAQIASIIFRLTLLVLLAVPSYWTWLYWTGRLGSRDK